MQEVLYQEKAPTENVTTVPEPIDHVENVVQSNQQQLDTQLQQMQTMMQEMQIRYAAAPKYPHQDYGGRG